MTKELEIRYDHPTDCFIIRNPEDTASLMWGECLYVFSTEEAARDFLQKTGLDLNQIVITLLSWDKLVEKFGERIGECVIDHNGEKEDYQTIVPLIAEIIRGTE